MSVVTDPLTLTELRRKYPTLFYIQHWFDGEAFMRVYPNERDLRAPTSVVKRGSVPTSSKGLPLAVDLATAYVNDPTSPTWQTYLWCRDVDALGQRIFVGSNGKGLEIHRHLVVTERFGVPRW